MKYLFLLLILLFMGCASPTTVYNKKVITSDTQKTVNCHRYKRKVRVKITQITESWDTIEPYDSDDKIEYNIVDEQDNIRVIE